MAIPDTVSRRLDAKGAVAWEDPQRGFFDRLSTQFLDLTVQPIAAGRMLRGEGASLWPAVRFGLIGVAIGYSPLALCLPCLLLFVPVLAASHLPPALAGLEAGMFCAMVAAAPFAIVLWHLFSDVIFGATFHALARLAGGTATLRESLRVALYARGTTAWLIFMWLFSWIPFVGLPIHLAFRLLFLLWGAFTFFGAAEGVHGLNEERSLLVAIGTILLGVLLVLGLSTVVALGGAILVFGSLTGIVAALPH